MPVDSPAHGLMTSTSMRHPKWVRRLAARAMWLEQEPIVLDPRTPIALDVLV